METKILDKSDSGLLRIQKIQHRLARMPKKYRKIYIKAAIHKNKDAAIKAFCFECVCWQKNEVIKCTSSQCPLYSVRPFANNTAQVRNE